jgi:hypothetical protein
VSVRNLRLPGVILVFSFYSRRRPNGKQTSFYQPVRISELNREFVSGSIRKIGFGFTNPAYLREFSQANAQALRGHFGPYTSPCVRVRSLSMPCTVIKYGAILWEIDIKITYL